MINEKLTKIFYSFELKKQMEEQLWICFNLI